jgi:hypothetical protein
MPEADRLIDQFRRAHDGDPWHGSPLKEILEGVTADQAARRPSNGAHSIWELALHITAWRNEVARRATGAPAGEPVEGDYPPVGDLTPEVDRRARGARRVTRASRRGRPRHERRRSSEADQRSP